MNVLQFPTHEARNRTETNRILRGFLKEAFPEHPENIEIVMDNMAEFLDLLEINFNPDHPGFTPVSAPAEFNSRFQEFKQAIQERSSRLIFERLRREIFAITG